MKKIFLKNIVLLLLSSTLISNFNTIQASAEWRTDSQNNTNWIENNVKATGWKIINQNWYYFYSNGAMARRWIKDGADWYHIADDGKMDIGWVKSNDKWYYLSDSGSMITGWLYGRNDGKWYYLSSEGSMITGWFDDGGKRYYLKASGEMVIGEASIEGIKYNFASDGSLINDKEEVKEEIEEKQIAYVNIDDGSLNVRQEASTESKILGTIKKGSQVYIIGKEKNGFFKVLYNDISGYVSSKFITFEKLDESSSSSESSDSDEKITLGKIRTTAPAENSQYYYSNLNIYYKAKYAPGFYKSNGQPIIGNCTWYAWGRMWELTGRIPSDAGLNGNAYEWWADNKRVGKYKYGSTPKVGAVAVWKSSIAGSGGSGHVAVVEKIEDGKVYISESSWHGILFKYRELYSINDLYGYIYIDEPNF